MFGYNIFDNSAIREGFNSSKEVILEAAELELRYQNLTGNRFQRFMQRIMDRMRGKQAVAENPIKIVDARVPKRPKRENNPVLGEELQSFRIRMRFDDGQRATFLVAFSGAGKLDNQTRGFISGIDLNGFAIPLTTILKKNRAPSPKGKYAGEKKGTAAEPVISNQGFKQVLQVFVDALESNRAEFAEKAAKKAQKQDSTNVATTTVKGGTADGDTSVERDETGMDKTTKAGRTEEGERIRKKFNKATGGGDDEADSPLKLSKRQRAKVNADQLAEDETTLKDLEKDISGLEKMRDSLKTRVSELFRKLEAAEQELARLEASSV